MHKLEILNQIESTQLIDSTRLNNFLKFVKYPKFNLFPNVDDNNINNYLFEIINQSFKKSTIYLYRVNSDIIALAIVRLSDWDSKHFGYKCASIDHIFYNQSIDSNLLYQALIKIICTIKKEVIIKKIKFMYVDINANDSVVSLALQSNNFKYILTWVDCIYNSKKKIRLSYCNYEIDIMKESEIEYYEKIASKHYFKGGRFYLDKNFDTSLVNNMYSNLIRSSYNNNDIMLSYRVNSRPIGLFICKKIISYNHFHDLKIAPLRYLIIDPEMRQKHIGYKLFAGTLNYLTDHCDIITSGLEVHNLPSLNLHMKLNFKINYTHNIYHFWSSK